MARTPRQSPADIVNRNMLRNIILEDEGRIESLTVSIETLSDDGAELPIVIRGLNFFNELAEITGSMVSVIDFGANADTNNYLKRIAAQSRGSDLADLSYWLKGHERFVWYERHLRLMFSTAVRRNPLDVTLTVIVLGGLASLLFAAALIVMQRQNSNDNRALQKDIIDAIMKMARNETQKPPPEDSIQREIVTSLLSMLREIRPPAVNLGIQVKTKNFTGNIGLREDYNPPPIQKSKVPGMEDVFERTETVLLSEKSPTEDRPQTPKPRRIEAASKRTPKS